ncbi:DUF769 domain-containing protein [Xylella fastidiosa]|uniref:DUF769 domain-containing protein n=1 Tax=Xylella fastidiosa TaxID=2371 RepID=UPI001F467C9C|nr:DUF769 domain-containing protein [Xylella fastidiosa]
MHDALFILFPVAVIYLNPQMLCPLWGSICLAIHYRKSPYFIKRDLLKQTVLASCFIVLQRQKRLDEVSALLDKKNPKNELLIAGIEVKATPRGSVGGSNKSGTTKVFDSRALTDAQIKDYAQQLTGGVPLKQTSRPGVYTAKLSDGTTVNLRSFSSSSDETKARWTIDIINNPTVKGVTDQRVELKFR